MSRIFCSVNWSSRMNCWLRMSCTLSQCLAFIALLRRAWITGSRFLYSSTAALSLGTTSFFGMPFSCCARSILKHSLLNLATSSSMFCTSICSNCVCDHFSTSSPHSLPPTHRSRLSPTSSAHSSRSSNWASCCLNSRWNFWMRAASCCCTFTRSFSSSTYVSTAVTPDGSVASSSSILCCASARIPDTVFVISATPASSSPVKALMFSSRCVSVSSMAALRALKSGSRVWNAAICMSGTGMENSSMSSYTLEISIDFWSSVDALSLTSSRKLSWSTKSSTLLSFAVRRPWALCTSVMKLVYSSDASSGISPSSCSRHRVGDGSRAPLSTLLSTRTMPTSDVVISESIFPFCVLKLVMSSEKSSSVRSPAWYAAANASMSSSVLDVTMLRNSSKADLYSSTASNDTETDSFTSPSRRWCWSSSMSSAIVLAVSVSVLFSRMYCMSSSWPRRRGMLASVSRKPSNTLEMTYWNSSLVGLNCSSWSSVSRISTVKSGPSFAASSGRLTATEKSSGCAGAASCGSFLSRSVTTSVDALVVICRMSDMLLTRHSCRVSHTM
mmetsp:Transcript_2865/g.10121  ORF Transcript_2865/g.10121 Transcript_2865/m.10121 type:complete len:557 (+) Transcript_2865:1682-3352(+)